MTTKLNMLQAIDHKLSGVIATTDRKAQLLRKINATLDHAVMSMDGWITLNGGSDKEEGEGGGSHVFVGAGGQIEKGASNNLTKKDNRDLISPASQSEAATGETKMTDDEKNMYVSWMHNSNIKTQQLFFVSDGRTNETQKMEVITDNLTGKKIAITYGKNEDYENEPYYADASNFKYNKNGHPIMKKWKKKDNHLYDLLTE